MSYKDGDALVCSGTKCLQTLADNLATADKLTKDGFGDLPHLPDCTNDGMFGLVQNNPTSGKHWCSAPDGSVRSKEFDAQKVGNAASFCEKFLAVALKQN